MRLRQLKLTDPAAPETDLRAENNDTERKMGLVL